jgi:hypothetical protein
MLKKERRTSTMRERVKVFTHASGEGSTVADTALQDMLNEWLTQNEGQILRITQSESARPGRAQHVTICIWYVPS